MVRLRTRIRHHPRFFLAVSFLIFVSVFASLFEFFTGLVAVGLNLLPLVGGVVGNTNPVYLPAANAEALGPPIGLPPIAIVQSGYRFLNATYTTSTNGFIVVWEYWYFFPPTPGHPANDWEYVYVYWDISGDYLNVPGPRLLAIAVRFHFAPRTIYPPIQVNVTQSITNPSITTSVQPYISFGYNCLGSVCGIIPTVKTGPIARFLKPTNATVLYNYLVTQDANSPPSHGPQAYEQTTTFNAGPPDPWALYGGLGPIANGIAYGSIFGGLVSTGFYGMIQLLENPPKTIRIRKRLVAVLLEE